MVIPNDLGRSGSGSQPARPVTAGTISSSKLSQNQPALPIVNRQSSNDQAQHEAEANPNTDQGGWRPWIAPPITEQECMTSQLRYAMNTAGLTSKDLRWGDYRKFSGISHCEVSFNDDLESRRFILEQLVLNRVNLLVLRVQMMVRRKLARQCVKEQRAYLLKHPRMPPKPLPVKFPIGTRVEARFKGKEVFYPGCVVGTATTKIGRKQQVVYDVLYDDGDRDPMLPMDYIRKIGGSKKEQGGEGEKGKEKNNRKNADLNAIGDLSDEEGEARRLKEEEGLTRELLMEAERENEARRLREEKKQRLKDLENEALQDELDRDQEQRAKLIAEDAERRAKQVRGRRRHSDIIILS